MTLMSLSIKAVILSVAQSTKSVHLEQGKRLPLCQNLFACVKKERNFFVLKNSRLHFLFDFHLKNDDDFPG